jgi:hypothetical protein
MMLSGDPVPPEAPARLRRPTASPSQGLIFALASPPVGRTEVLWPSWLAPIGASWKRPSASRTQLSGPRSE